MTGKLNGGLCDVSRAGNVHAQSGIRLDRQDMYQTWERIST
jgi:hypothetical protein